MMRFNPPGSPPIHFNELHHVLYSTGTFWLLIFLADHERTNELGDFQFVKKSVQSVELIKGLIARLVCLSVCLFVCRAIYPNWTSVSINSPCLVSFKSKSPFLCVCSQCLTIPAANAAPESKICTLCIVQLSDSMKAEHIVSDSSVSRRKCNNQLQSRKKKSGVERYLLLCVFPLRSKLSTFMRQNMFLGPPATRSIFFGEIYMNLFLTVSSLFSDTGHALGLFQLQLVGGILN